MRCGICDHRMQSNPNHDANHYRSRFPRDFAPVDSMDHPSTVYVREDVIVPKLNEWIESAGSTSGRNETCRVLAAAGGATDVDHARIEAARRKLDDCDKRLTKLRGAEHIDDPKLVAG